MPVNTHFSRSSRNRDISGSTIKNMETIQTAPTIDDVLNYEEELLSTVEKQSSIECNPRAKELLLKLQVLLKSRGVRSFVNLLAERKFSLSSLQKIAEIDDTLDELRVMNLDLPYPDKRFLLEQGKTERAKRNMMMTLIFGLFGFEWVK